MGGGRSVDPQILQQNFILAANVPEFQLYSAGALRVLKY